MNKKTNYTIIDLGDCEDKLKTENNLPENASIYILKIYVKQEGYKIPTIEYEVCYPLNTKYNVTKLYLINLSVCNDANIDVCIPLIYNGSLDEIDHNSDFYNDICNTFTSENETDLTLSERKKNYINNNLTVCEENCNFQDYNITTEKVICSCQVKTSFLNQISEYLLIKEKLYECFTDFNNIIY